MCTTGLKISELYNISIYLILLVNYLFFQIIYFFFIIIIIIFVAIVVFVVGIIIFIDVAIANVVIIIIINAIFIIIVVVALANCVIISAIFMIMIMIINYYYYYYYYFMCVTETWLYNNWSDNFILSNVNYSILRFDSDCHVGGTAIIYNNAIVHLKDSTVSNTNPCSR